LAAQHDVVFLLDVDNTLIDNDAVEVDLRTHLRTNFGSEGETRFWVIFEELRAELGYADYLGALQRYRVEHMRDPELLAMSLYLMDYPFANRLYAGALEVVGRLRERGQVVILSDGDVVFQPRKIQRSGLWDAVGGNVLIYIHKEQMLEDVAARYPAAHYVMVDDKVRILALMKQVWGPNLTTVFPRQGHYAADQKVLSEQPSPDVTLEHIAELAGEGLLEKLVRS
jgi:FMN phosphatase YigB (HAD superfamily)